MTFVSYAQNFEDVLLWRLLHDVERGQYLDIGAQDPVFDSVSLAFYNAGWRGLHVEPTPAYAARLRESRPDETVIEAAVTCAVGPIEFYEIPETGLSTGKAEIAERHRESGYEKRKILVPGVRLDNLLESVTGDLHWMKIDVEGMEPEVLKSWGDHPLRPWVLLIEATFPSSQERSEHLWIEEVRRRGYREAHFDGLSRYFIHEDHEELAGRLETPPNVFDAFHVTSTHFSAGMLNENSIAELEELRNQANEREAQLSKEIAGLGQALETASAETRQAQSERLAAADALATSEREYRSTIDLMWRERHVLETASAEEIRQAQSERLAAVDALAASEREYRSAIELMWRERHELETRWREIERRLRDQLSSAENQMRRDGAELAALRERTAEDRDRIQEIQEEARAAREQIVSLDDEISALRTSAREQDEQTAAQIGERTQQLAYADQLIRKALAEPLGRWQRLGRALALFREDGARSLLRSWNANLSLPVASHVETVMSVPSGEVPNPYLRANTLSELLSWDDADFVRCAYVTILGRQPDPEGEAYYTDRIRRGYSKMHVLWQLRTSREGPRHDPGIAGLDRALRRDKRTRMPVLGAFLRLWSEDGGNGEAAMRHRIVVNQFSRVLELQRRQLELQNNLLGRIDRRPVILPTAYPVADDVRSCDELGETAHLSQLSERELADIRYLSADARKLYTRFTGSC